MLLAEVEKILNKEPHKKFTVDEVVDLLLITHFQNSNKQVIEAKIVNKIIKNSDRLGFSFGTKDGLLYLYSRSHDKTHRLNRKTSDDPFFVRLKKIKIRLTIFYIALLLIGFSYVYFFK